ncbi:MAG: SRPBCC domain-containing protein [Candidatus Limnocylindria bacterium]
MATTEPVRHAVTVSLPVDEAWRLFTEQMGRWWPLESHSLYGSDATGIEVETREGGEVRELASDGRAGHWATILAWEPGERLVLSWELDRDRPRATEVEVRFAPSEDGGTRVELEHRHWERLGDEAAAGRESYRTGWAFVLSRYEAAVAEGAAATA